MVQVVTRKVYCANCLFECDIEEKNSMGDGYCPQSDKTLVGYVNNGKSGRQPRFCQEYEPDVAKIPVTFKEWRRTQK